MGHPNPAEHLHRIVNVAHATAGMWLKLAQPVPRVVAGDGAWSMGDK